MFDLIFKNVLVHYNDVQAFEYSKNEDLEGIFFMLSSGNKINVETDKKVFDIIVMFQKLVVKTRFLQQRITDEIAYLDFTSQEVINAQYKHFKTLLENIEKEQEQATKLMSVLTDEEKNYLKIANENKDTETIKKIKEKALARI